MDGTSQRDLRPLEFFLISFATCGFALSCYLLYLFPPEFGLYYLAPQWQARSSFQCNSSFGSNFPTSYSGFWTLTLANSVDLEA